MSDLAASLDRSRFDHGLDRGSKVSLFWIRWIVLGLIVDRIVLQGIALFWILVRRVLPRFLVLWILILGVLGLGVVHKSLCLVSRRYPRSSNKGLKVGTLRYLRTS